MSKGLLFLIFIVFHNCMSQNNTDGESHKLIDDRIKNGDLSSGLETIEVIQPIDDCFEEFGPMTPVPVRKHLKKIEKIRRAKYYSKPLRPNHHRRAIGVRSDVLEYSFFRSRKNPLSNEPIKWVHCVEFISPFVKNSKLELKLPKFLQKDDHEVQRLVHLLRINTTEYTNEEVMAILVQISKISFRLYYWDVNAIKTLLNTIISGPVHSFKTLKKGLKELFKKWRLDFTNGTSLLIHSKVFRPMCLRDPKLDASTKLPNLVRFIQPTTTTEGACLQYDAEGYCTKRRSQ